MGRKRITECCGAEPIGELAHHGSKRSFYTCSKCGLWPTKLIIVEEKEDEGKTNNRSELEKV